MLNKKGFTLLELLIVIVTITILTTLAVANYSRTKENVLDKEAISNLKVIQVAERSYYLDSGTSYYPDSGSVSDIATINQNLHLSLPSSSQRGWDYTVWDTGCGRATRNGGDGRSWYLAVDDLAAEPDSGAGCS
jgi:prepilin-type N-terminal cleavage/methylation domain-containing protein